MTQSDDQPSPELTALLDTARWLLRQSWRINGNNQLVGARLETIAVVLELAGHDTTWIDFDWRGSYLAYVSAGGRGKFHTLWRGWH